MLISEEGFREDGRTAKELRRIEVSRGRIKTSGYVDLRQGNTQVMTVCSGPKEPGKLNVKVSFYSVARQEPVNEKRVMEYENLLFDIFSSIVLSESLIDIDVVVKEDGGSLLSTMINSMNLCLSYFGIPLVDMCCSITLTGDCIDLSSTEDSQRIPVVTLAYLVNRESIAYLSSDGRMPLGLLRRCILDGMDACIALYKHFKDPISFVDIKP